MIIIAVLKIVYFFDPFSAINFPRQLAFLKDKQFTPLGNSWNFGFYDFCVSGDD